MNMIPTLNTQSSLKQNLWLVSFFTKDQVPSAAKIWALTGKEALEMIRSFGYTFYPNSKIRAALYR